MCCAPKSPSEGGGKFFGAGVLLLIAGVIQLIMAIVTVILMAMLLTAVNEDYCGKRFSDCSMAEDESICASGICYKEVSTGSGVPPNSDSCEGHNFDGVCDDGGNGAIWTWTKMMSPSGGPSLQEWNGRKWKQGGCARR